MMTETKMYKNKVKVFISFVKYNIECSVKYSSLRKGI